MSLSLINWNQVCNEKKFEGLGIKDNKTWNLASLGKHILNIAMKQDSLWIRCVDGVYLKGRDLWVYQLPTTTNWHWCKLIYARDYFSNSYQNGVWAP